MFLTKVVETGKTHILFSLKVFWKLGRLWDNVVDHLRLACRI